MFDRILLFVVVPVVSLLIAASMIATDARQNANQSAAVERLAELTSHAAALDAALGAETVAAASTLDASGIAAAAEATDRRLEEMRAHVMASGTRNPHVVPSMDLVDEILLYRTDIEAGLISPLQIADRYRGARRLIRSAIATEAQMISPDLRTVDVSAMLALVNASSSHVDERLSVWLALRYGRWAPGQLAVAVGAVERQRLHLAEARALVGDSPVGPHPELGSIRAAIVQSNELPELDLDEWNRISDEWSRDLDQAIDRHVSDVALNAHESSVSAQRAFGLTVAATALLLLLAAVSAARIARRRHRELRDLEYRATHDGLTGLANRALVMDHLDRLCSSCSATTPPGILFLDLDGFKPINDALGHERGDQVLCEVGARLRETLDQTTAVVGRIGGDEFVVVVEQVEDVRALVDLAGAVRTTIRSVSIANGFELDVSIGVAVLRPGMSHDELLSAADDAMYEAKGSMDRLRVASASSPVNTTETPDRVRAVVSP